MIKTKIIATLGPSCNQQETIKSMIDNGADIFRLNFSHGTLDGHAKSLEMLNAARAQHRHTTAVMCDLCGPKIRIGRIHPEGDVLKAGDEVSIIHSEEQGNVSRFGTNYEYFSQDVEVGQRIFIDDGQIALRVIHKDDDQTVCKVVVGGPLRSHKGINLPDTKVSVPSITERDWQCVDWAIQHEADFLALSFVRSAEVINQLKSYLSKAGADIKIIAKIETPQALKHLESIIHASDAILVARGDLGVEMDLAEVPVIQKRITQICRHLGKPVIVATQMLQGMIDNPVATRAEVSDVANAIMDFTDVVMLSGETAVGKYPLNAAKTIGRIARVTEAYLHQNEDARPKTITRDELVLTAAMTRSVDQIVDDISAKFVAVWSQTGSTVRLLSKERISVPILALSSDQRTCNQMSLHYGVIPRCQPIPEDINQFTHIVDHLIISRNWAQIGDKVVLLAGQPIGIAGTTNAVIVHTISDRQSPH
ncbi:MAG: pyruvate kinase [Candidatus Scalindua rubra]|uniref:Pyruvate kinase n=1 Tax=Candidatus Scalindua rubra TaxID=1872076 RepID=A0A1E3X784_9BACT|nr:MAG: pyruvate kinase [Candidatus Scalindua rubra]